MKHTLKEAMSYAKETKAMGILEKDGAYQTAKDWNEIRYAEKCGWNYIGHPADLSQSSQTIK